MIIIKRPKFKRPRKNTEVKKNEGKKTRRIQLVEYPAKLVAPVARFLRARLKILERRKKDIEEEDPFSDTSRILDNASPDTDAAEQFGHARTEAIRRQLDRKIIQTRKALTMVKIGKYGICEVCGEMIDTDRLVVYPEATLCARDAAKEEK